MWERIIEYGLSFFVHILKGQYSVDIILYLVLLGGGAGVLEIWRAGRRGISLKRYGWIKEGAVAFLGSFIMVGVCVFVYKCLQRAMPGLGLPGTADASSVALLAIYTVAAACIGIMMVELLYGAHGRLALNRFWVLFGMGATVLGAYVIKLAARIPSISDIAYIIMGVIAAILIVAEYALREIAESGQYEAAEAMPEQPVRSAE